MFQRRVPQSLLAKAKEFFWPTMGWKRSFVYIKHRLVRLSDSSHKIALGLAIGAGVSFTPIVGTHFIQAGFAAHITKSNFLSAIVGTFVGNPWTFPFMWWASIEFGGFLFSLLGLSTDTQLPDEFNLWVFFDLLQHDPLRVLLPWTIGGYLLCFMSIPLNYVICYRLISSAKKARARARLRKMRRVAKEVTGVKQ